MKRESAARASRETSMALSFQTAQIALYGECLCDPSFAIPRNTLGMPQLVPYISSVHLRHPGTKPTTVHGPLSRVPRVRRERRHWVRTHCSGGDTRDGRTLGCAFSVRAIDWVGVIWLVLLTVGILRAARSTPKGYTVKGGRMFRWISEWTCKDCGTHNTCPRRGAGLRCKQCKSDRDDSVGFWHEQSKLPKAQRRRPGSITSSTADRPKV